MREEKDKIDFTEVYDEDLRHTFGENLKATRLKKGIKQSEIADKLNITQQYISSIEKGSKNVTIKSMMELAGAVGSDVRTLLTKRGIAEE